MSNLLTEISTESYADNRDKAERCLRELDRLPAEDLARPDLRSAAQTFALLHLADIVKQAASRWPIR